MKRWFVIRHIRAIMEVIDYSWRTARRGVMWGIRSGEEIMDATKTNSLFVEERRQHEERLQAIWDGKA